MKTRVISGTILGIILAALIIIGGVPLLVGSMLVGLQGCYELYKVGGISRKPYTYISYPLIIGIYYLIFKGYFNAV